MLIQRPLYSPSCIGHHQASRHHTNDGAEELPHQYDRPIDFLAQFLSAFPCRGLHTNTTPHCTKLHCIRFPNGVRSLAIDMLPAKRSAGCLPPEIGRRQRIESPLSTLHGPGLQRGGLENEREGSDQPWRASVALGFHWTFARRRRVLCGGEVTWRQSGHLGQQVPGR